MDPLTWSLFAELAVADRASLEGSTLPTHLQGAHPLTVAAAQSQSDQVVDAGQHAADLMTGDSPQAPRRSLAPRQTVSEAGTWGGTGWASM